MTSKHPRQVVLTTAAGADNLQAIDGIGPAIESRLHAADIRTFDQLAATPPDKIAAIAGKSADQIAREGWIGQARRLTAFKQMAHSAADQISPAAGAAVTLRASETALEEWSSFMDATTGDPGQAQLSAEQAMEAVADEAVEKPSRQRESFVVRFFLEDDHRVGRTEVEHATSEGRDQWPGWDPARLADFFVRQAGLRITPAEAAATAVGAEPVPPAATTRLAGALHLRDLATLPGGALPHGQPVHVRLTLDPGDVTAPGDVPLSYTVTVYAKNLGSGARQGIGEAHGAIATANSVAVDVEGAPLPQGIYHLDATATLALPSERPGLAAFLEGGLLQIY